MSNVSIFEIIKKISESPDDVLGDKSIIRLDAYVGGCFHAWEHAKVAEADRAASDLASVRKHFMERFDVRSEYDAFDIAALVSRNDGEALDLFCDECLRILKEPERAAEPSGSVTPKLNASCSVWRMLTEVRGCPHLFMGARSFSRLSAYIRGYVFVAHSMGCHSEREFKQEMFARWLRERFGFNSAFEWERIIRFLRKSDEGLALELFFELLDEYMKNAKKDSGVV